MTMLHKSTAELTLSLLYEDHNVTLLVHHKRIFIDNVEKTEEEFTESPLNFVFHSSQKKVATDCCCALHLLGG